MSKVLHFPADKTALGESFTALAAVLEDARNSSAARVVQARKFGGPSEALVLNIANRLFGQMSYEFRTAFLQQVERHFNAPLETMNFLKNADAARRDINHWVEEKPTRDRIQDILPPGGLTADTRLVLVNAMHMKVGWEAGFP